MKNEPQEGLGDITSFGYVKGGLGVIPSNPKYEGVASIGLNNTGVNFGLPDGITADRLRGRSALRDRVDRVKRLSGTGPLAWDGYCDRALDSLRSAEAAGAFRIDREDPRLRDRYGRTIHGQCLLLGRRLIEAGVPLVTVNWHDDHSNFWDTHGDNFNQLKNRLMPPADEGLSALLDDLEARGLLEETLVVWVGEFGRKPQITARNAGREHWPHCYSDVLAGAGIRGGALHRAGGRARLDRGARRVSQRTPAVDCGAGRHRAGVGRAATAPGRHRALAL